MIKVFKYLSYVLSVFLFILLINTETFGFSGTGSGTQSDPYIIMTPQQFIEINSDLAAHYKLGNDLDFSGITYEPIANISSKPFKGTLDGDNCKIKNLVINKKDSNYLGIFGYIQSSTIKNLMVDKVNITGKEYLGVISGWSVSSTITNVVASGRITGGAFVGGLVGYESGTVIEKSFSDVALFLLSGYTTSYSTNYTLIYRYFGGIIGQASGGTVSECYYSSVIDPSHESVGNYFAGIVGKSNGITIENCHASGTYYGTIIAGLIGESTGDNIKNSFFWGDLDAYERPVYSRKIFGLGNNIKSVVNSYTAIQGTTSSTYYRPKSELNKQSTFVDWDFDNIWKMNVYPSLRNIPALSIASIKNLKVTEVQSDEISLTWDSSSAVAGASYEVRYNDQSQTVNTNSITLSGLTSNTSYSIMVRFKYGTAIGYFSNVINEKTPHTTVGVPKDITISEKTATTLKINWPVVADATSYTVDYNGTEITVNTNSCILTNLIPSTSYDVKIKSEGQHNESAFSEVFTFETLPIGISTEFMCYKKTFDNIKLNWEKLDGAISYEIMMNGEIIPSVKTEIELSELIPNTEYVFKVRGINKEIKGEWSKELKILTEKTTAMGTGTITDPYIIQTPQQFMEIKHNLSAHYKLGNDLDFTGIIYEPIGTSAENFTGSLDGANFKILNLTISKSDTDYIGLFAYSRNAEIKNLHLENIDITGRSYVGGLVAHMTNSKINNCSVNGEIRGDIFIGGLLSYGNNVDIAKSYVLLNIYTQKANSLNIGGLASYINGSVNINESFSKGVITGVAGTDGKININGAAGLVCSFSTTGNQIVENSFSIMDIKVDAGLRAGLVADKGNVQINNSYFGGKLYGDSIDKIPLGGNILINSYFNSDNTGETIYLEGSKSPLDMKNINTYVNWDFENIWAISSKNPYPYLISLPNAFNNESGIKNLKVTQKTHTTITLSWDAVSDAISYKVSYGNQNIITTEPTLTIINLEPQTTYILKIRTLKENNVGPWSDELMVSTNSSAIFKDGEMRLKLEKDQEYTLAFNGSHLENLEYKIFIINYDASSLSFIDFVIKAEGLEIIEHSSGEIKLKLNKGGLKDSAWSGFITAIKFKALATEETTVTFRQ